jgi:hypothetical protein
MSVQHDGLITSKRPRRYDRNLEQDPFHRLLVQRIVDPLSKTFATVAQLQCLHLACTQP